MILDIFPLFFPWFIFLGGYWFYWSLISNFAFCYFLQMLICLLWFTCLQSFANILLLCKRRVFEKVHRKHMLMKKKKKKHAQILIALHWSKLSKFSAIRHIITHFWHFPSLHRTPFSIWWHLPAAIVEDIPFMIPVGEICREQFLSTFANLKTSFLTYF